MEMSRRCHYWIFNTRKWFIRFIVLADMCSFCWQKCGSRPTDFSISCALYCYWLSTWGTSEFLKGKAKSCFRDWPFAYFSGGFISHLFRYYSNTHTNKKDTVCLMTSVHPTFSPHNLFSNSHQDERTSFLISQLPKNRREFILKVLKVHINRILLYLYSTNPRNRYKPKPKHEWAGSKSPGFDFLVHSTPKC